MSSDSPESSGLPLRELYASHSRATRAMLSRIALRSPELTQQLPDLQADTTENAIRAAIWSSEHDIVQADPDQLHRPDTRLSLAETMAKSYIEELAMPGRPLTKTRLMHIDPKLLRVAEDMEGSDVGWPDEETVFHDVLPEDYDDFAFAHRLAGGSRGYNNFPALLSTLPSLPDTGEYFMNFMHRTPMYQYASKPYLARAHALQPDFMQALQKSMSEVGSPQEWRERLMRASDEEHADPEDMVLLRASRLSYQLLINLMRKDDLNIQSRLLTMSLQDEITDPLVELWT